jgi:hypothetical protein
MRLPRLQGMHPARSARITPENTRDVRASAEKRANRKKQRIVIRRERWEASR